LAAAPLPLAFLGLAYALPVLAFALAASLSHSPPKWCTMLEEIAFDILPCVLDTGVPTAGSRVVGHLCRLGDAWRRQKRILQRVQWAAGDAHITALLARGQVIKVAWRGLATAPLIALRTAGVTRGAAKQVLDPAECTATALFATATAVATVAASVAVSVVVAVFAVATVSDVASPASAAATADAVSALVSSAVAAFDGVDVHGTLCVETGVLSVVSFIAGAVSRATAAAAR